MRVHPVGERGVVPIAGELRPIQEHSVATDEKTHRSGLDVVNPHPIKNPPIKNPLALAPQSNAKGLPWLIAVIGEAAHAGGLFAVIRFSTTV
jgi:hypothetical protein